MITEYHGKGAKNNETNLRYELSVFTGTAIVDVSIIVFAGASKEAFCKKICQNYGNQREEIDVEKHIGSVVLAKISVYESKNGDQHLRLIEYSPYHQKEDL
ncbi:MAG: hypothetical protein IKR97_00415 [Eubacterium sp.]|nr:hypothetical protein [Eubacterium sp.]